MDASTITILGVVISNSAMIIPLFLWVRMESRADIRHIDNKIDLYRLETKTMIQAIQDEMKDFHNRLCKIENERNK